ncbi:MAG: hypothetical protein RSA79_07625, partial [Oscillospiraceae bacterium]
MDNIKNTNTFSALFGNYIDKENTPKSLLNSVVLYIDTNENEKTIIITVKPDSLICNKNVKNTQKQL